MSQKVITSRLDSRRRAVMPSVFQPGDSLVSEVIDEKTVVFRLIQRAEKPAVRIAKKGKRLFVKQQTKPADIARAVRQDRDSR